MRLLSSFMLLTLTGCGHSIVLKKPPAAERATLNAEWLKQIRAVAKPGDWLVVRGYKKVDNLVVAATNIPLSHAAVYDAERDQVIEAIGDGVQTAPMEKFVDMAHRVLVIRPRWWTPERGIEAVKFALTTIDKKYDFLGTVGGGSADRYYCSELCVEAYRKHHDKRDHLPRVLEPGQMYLWGQVLYDSRPRY